MSLAKCTTIWLGIIFSLSLSLTLSVWAQVRVEAANLFARLGKDKLHGPKINLILVKFLPRIFMDAWKESPEYVALEQNKKKGGERWRVNFLANDIFHPVERLCVLSNA